MISRVFAWGLLALACYGGYRGWQAFENPWGASGAALSAVPRSPVLDALPVVTPCGKDCTQ